jgi:hypothetical protein
MVRRRAAGASVKVLLLAPFIIGKHPTLKSADRHEAAITLRAVAELEGFRLPPERSKPSLSIDPEHPLAAATLNGPLLEGFVPVRPASDDGSARPADSLEVRLVVGKLGVGFFVATTDVDRLTGPTDLELSLEKPLNELVRRVSNVVAGSVPDVDLASWRQASAMPDGIAWWHRIAVGVRHGDEPQNAAFGQVLRRGSREVGLIGSGFSVLWESDPDIERECVNGLMAATEEWLVVDRVNSLLADRLAGLESLTGNGRAPRLHAIHSEILDVAVEVAIVRLVVDERARYLVRTERAAREAAREAWAMTGEYESLDSRLSTLRQLAEAHRNEIQARRDARRNDLLFAFTVMAIIQSLLVVFDFLTGSNVTLAPIPRVAYGVLVTAAALLVLGLGVVRLTRPRD